jgi:hypothetical protein
MQFADLELSLHRRGDARYAVEARFSQPESDADIRLLNEEVIVQLESAELRQLEIDPLAYGQALSQHLFAPPALRSAFARARTAADSANLPLRVRLFIAPSAQELHGLRWETLHDPEEDRPLLTSERLFFSRYLASGDWRPVKLRPKASLRALVVIANPADLADYDMAEVDLPAELERAQKGLGQIEITTLAAPGQATIEHIGASLRDGYDILYLVAHGTFVDDESWLWLEDETGNIARTAGSELITRMQELDQRPRLIVLVSCQSAGNAQGEADSITALGPRLAEAGVPAVIAMQGNLSMVTAAAFLPVFFTELQRDGQIDRAVAVARGAVRQREDSWMPVLFMRLRSGRIWYVPGFGDDGASFEKWPTIVRSIRRGQCTPIIGAHFTERVLGSPQQVAQRWAETYNFPMAPHQREDLPQVSQYLAINQDAQFPRDELAQHMRRELLRKLPAKSELTPDSELTDLLAAIGAHEREHNPSDPNKLLAEQPFPIYITSTQHTLLTEALKAVGKDPQTEICIWNDELKDILISVFEDEPDYKPTAERPLIFHLFGRVDVPESLVLTEDDFFDYLIAISLERERIPPVIREALTDTALLFLGFRLDDWDFRVLYRSLMSQEGRNRRRKYAHIAGQVMFDEERFLAPERAKKYLETYFQSNDISLFWGSVDDFARALQGQLAVAEDEPAAPARPEQKAGVRRRL